MSGQDGSQEQSLRHSEPTQSQMSGHDGSKEQSLTHSESTKSQTPGNINPQEQSSRHSESTKSQTPGNRDSLEQSSRQSEPTRSQTTGHVDLSKKLVGHSDPTISQASNHAEHYGYIQRPSTSSNPSQTSQCVMAGLPSTSRYDRCQAAHLSQMAEDRSSRKRRISDDDHNASAVPRKRGKSIAMQLN